MIDWAIRRRVVIPEPSSHSEDGVQDWADIGRIYEHLACYYLSSVGFKAEIKDAAGYDILAECPDGKFFKVEVKSSTPRVYCDRAQGSMNFGGMRKKAIADVFMFFDRTTNYMHLMFAEEVDCSVERKCLTMHVFSDHNTQLGLSRLSSFVPSDDLAFVYPSPEEELKLNREWVLDNMDIVQEINDKIDLHTKYVSTDPKFPKAKRGKGVEYNIIAEVFNIGSFQWIRRICRQDRSRTDKGITDTVRHKLRISNAYINN